MPTKKDKNYLKESPEYSEEEAKEVAKEIFAPLQRQDGLPAKEKAYQALDELLSSDAEFKNKYDQILNKIIGEALYNKVLSVNFEEDSNIEEDLQKAASKRY